jgi:hypothetical protein
MAQKKIDIYANFQPTSIDNTGAQSMQALAGLAESVGDVAFQIGKQKRTEEGAAAGALAGQEAVETGELGDVNTFSFYGQAFKQERDRAYLSGLNSSMEQDLSAAFAQAEVAPNKLETFDTLSQAWYAGTSKNASENAIPLIKGTFDNVAGAYRTRLIAAEAKQVAEDNITASALLTFDLGNTALRIADTGDLESADVARRTYAAAVMEDPYSSLKDKIEQLTEYNYTYEGAESTGALNSIFNNDESGGIAAAIDFVRDFNATENIKMTPQPQLNEDGELILVDKPMLPENKEKIADLLQSQLTDLIDLADRKEKILEDEADAFYADNEINLSIAISNGELTPAQLVTSLRNKEITIQAFGTLERQLQSRGAGIDDFDYRDAVETAISNRDFAEATRLINYGVGTQLSDSSANEFRATVRDMQSPEGLLNSFSAKRNRGFLQQLLGNVNALTNFYEYENKEKAIDMLMVFDRRVMAGENPDIVLRDLDVVRMFNYGEQDISIFVNNNQNEKQAIEAAETAFESEIATLASNGVDVENKNNGKVKTQNSIHLENVRRIKSYFANQAVIQQFDKDLQNRFGIASDAGTE